MKSITITIFIISALFITIEIQGQGSVHRTQYLYQSEFGSIKLNGQIPEGFNIPKEEVAYVVHYLGAVTNQDFPFLPFDELNLFCPEFLKGILFIDYSDPNLPHYVNEDAIHKTTFEEKEFTIKEFTEVKLIADRKSHRDRYCFGQIGNPDWIQHPEVPISVITNKAMKFLIQIDPDPFLNEEFENKNYFRGYPPVIYVFIEPETNLIAIKLQST